ncbi:Golgi-associated plant pathogenesis-related protein 1-like [Amblyomma americanum]
MRFRSFISIAVLVLTLLIAVEARRKIKAKEYKGRFTPFMKKFQRQVLQQHNVLRPKHGVPKLKLNEKLNRFAQARANELAKRVTNENGHRLWHIKKYPFGENLYWISEGARFTGEQSAVVCGETSCTMSARSYFVGMVRSSAYVFKPGKTVVDVWYAEIRQHNFNQKNPPREVLHFTQVVWKKSRRLGVGIAKAKDGSYYVSALYDPKGNNRDQYLENVPRPIRGRFSSSLSCS